MNSKQSNRRRFLKDGAVLAGLAVGAMSTTGAKALAAEADIKLKDIKIHAYGERSRFVTSERPAASMDMGEGGGGGYGFMGRTPVYSTPLQDLLGTITPASLHFVESHGYDPPDIDPSGHRLMIHGMVNRPLIFTMEELKRLPSISRIHLLECQANGRNQGDRKSDTLIETTGRTSCTEWTGVPLPLLLKEAGVHKDASWIVSEGLDGSKYTKSLPLAKATEDVIVAYGQNGEPLRPENGFPLRLIVPGFEGLNNVKWLRRIKVVDELYLARLEVSRYMNYSDPKARYFNFEMGPKSVITRPAGGQKLAGPGFYQITGLAWSGGGAIKKVEVSTDGGSTWKDAEITGPVHRIAHTRFGLAWKWNGEETVLMSRCTDDVGQVQPTIAEYAKFWGFTVQDLQNGKNGFGHFNAIQPWKISQDRSVHNAIFS